MTDLSLQRRFAQPAPIPLGIDTKSPAIPPAISPADAAVPDAGGSKRRAERYQLQRVAQRCLPENRVFVSEMSIPSESHKHIRDC